MIAATPRDAERQLRAQGYSRKAAKIAVSAMNLQGTFKQQPKQNIFTRICNAIKGA